MIGKQLSALLQILRSNGVTRYETPELSLQLGPAPAPRTPKDAVHLDVSPEALAEDEQDQKFEQDGDFRFALERIAPRHFPRRADPRRNKAPQ